MSYMNDDTDPFGVPYNTTVSTTPTNEGKTYSLKDLKCLKEKVSSLNKELYDTEHEIKKAEEQLKKRISKCVDTFAKVKWDRRGNCKIITSNFTLSQIEKLKEDFNLKDVEVKCDKVNTVDDFYVDRIVITLKE